ncbi:phosphatidylglycerophosphatase [Methanosphaera sp. WGK6]|nr:phosphatidylglycerophosphatase [Methanosphaera sp. WGK6]
MEDIGVTLENMEDAAMELVVGVDEDEKIIREKFRKQLLHSLEDINVISYLVAAIRLEEDYEHYRIREVNVDDDPAYLYMDEIMGMAIANQIAGTKAIFNFKLYDEKKPGILSVLGPSVDDIIGGLIAGCMSKIFEP